MDEKPLWPLENLYKRKINEDNIRFILDNSNIHQEVLKKIMCLCSDNAYHNYGHTLGVMKTVIEIAQAQGIDKKMTTKLLMAAGVHDSFHPGVATPSDEMRSVIVMFDHITDRDLILCGLTVDDRKPIGDYILATTFDKRGRIADPMAFIIQDADIGYMGKNKYIYLLASIGLIDEFSRAYCKEPDPVRFIRLEQKPFIEHVISMSPSKDTFFLSEGAKKIMNNPMKTLEDLLLWPDRIYWLVYDLRQTDITMANFITMIDRQVSFT